MAAKQRNPLDETEALLGLLTLGKGIQQGPGGYLAAPAPAVGDTMNVLGGMAKAEAEREAATAKAAKEDRDFLFNLVKAGEARGSHEPFRPFYSGMGIQTPQVDLPRFTGVPKSLEGTFFGQKLAEYGDLFDTLVPTIGAKAAGEMGRVFLQLENPDIAVDTAKRKEEAKSRVRFKYHGKRSKSDEEKAKRLKADTIAGKKEYFTWRRQQQDQDQERERDRKNWNAAFDRLIAKGVTNPTLDQIDEEKEKLDRFIDKKKRARALFGGAMERFGVTDGP